MTNDEHDYFGGILLRWLREKTDERWYGLAAFRDETLMYPSVSISAMKRLAKQNLIETERATGRYYMRAIRGID